MKFSVLINNYNYGRYLKDSINSVINQSYYDFEVIVYDDGSTDDSVKIIKSFSSDCKIILRANHGDLPIWNQLNAIQESFNSSVGEYICLLDADDMFVNNKLECLAQYINENPGLDMIQHSMLEVNSWGLKTGRCRPFICSVDPRESILKSNNLINLCTQTSGLIFSRNFLMKFLPFEKDNYSLVWADVRLSRMACLFGKVGTIRIPLSYYRVHDTNDSSRLNSKKVLYAAINQQYDFCNKKLKKYNQNEIIKPRLFTNHDSGILPVIFWYLKYMTMKDIFNLIVFKLKNKFKYE